MAGNNFLAVIYVKEPRKAQGLIVMGDNWSPKKTAHMNSLPGVTTITMAPVIFYFIAFSNLPSAYRW